MKSCDECLHWDGDGCELEGDECVPTKITSEFKLEGSISKLILLQNRSHHTSSDRDKVKKILESILKAQRDEIFADLKPLVDKANECTDYYVEGMIEAYDVQEIIDKHRQLTIPPVTSTHPGQ